MKKTVITFVIGYALLLFPCLANAADGLKIGWQAVDITPDKPVLIAGQFHARLSEKVQDPITATALVIESDAAGKKETVIMVAIDWVSLSDGMRDPSNIRKRIRDKVKELEPAIPAEKIVFNATHSHSAPLVSDLPVEMIYGITPAQLSPLKPMMPPSEYSKFAAQRIAEGVVQAWKTKKKGGISYGLTKAVIGYNRLQVRTDGKSLMYGNTADDGFSHLEGYENHNLNLLYTWDAQKNLTGVVLNVPVPSQVSESIYDLSADFWNEVRIDFKKRFGPNVHVLGQVSAAGDQSPHHMWGSKAEERMQQLMGMASDGVGRGAMANRRMIAHRLTEATAGIMAVMKENIEWTPVVKHRLEHIQLNRRLLNEDDLKTARQEIETWKPAYEKRLQEAVANPKSMEKSRWYTQLTIDHTRYRRGTSVLERYELEKKSATLPVEVQVIRIGDMAIASNPFELYLDYGIQILAKSKATQTFVVQLAGSGTYLPTQRSINGGAYGAVPASTIFGPEGGKQLVDKTLQMIDSLFE